MENRNQIQLCFDNDIIKQWQIYLTWAIILVAGKINWNNREFNNWILWGAYISTSAWNYYREQPTTYNRSKEQDHLTHSFWQAAQYVSILVYSWYYCCNGGRSHFVDSHDVVDMVEMYHTCQGLLFCYKTKPHDTPQAVTSWLLAQHSSTACSVA